MSDALKPCPFCGSPTIVDGTDEIGYYATCGRCSCSLGWDAGLEVGDDYGKFAHEFCAEAEAVAAWNQRACDRLIVGYLVYSSDITLGAWYPVTQRTQAVDAARRGNCRITALGVATALPAEGET